MNITEELNTPVRYTCDVLVVGGGVAGIASALSATREGKSVMLIERSFMLGGLATAGLITIYLPICDGYGHQVCYGIAEELLKLSISIEKPMTRGMVNWVLNNDSELRNENTPRYQVDFNPYLFAISAEQLLIKEGVHILYGTTAVACTMDDATIDTVIVENKSGRSAIRAKAFIDASGDADLAEMAHAPTRLFKQGNILAAWYYSNRDGMFTRNQLGACDVPDEEKKVGAPEVVKLSERRYTGIDAEEISEFVIDSHASLLNRVKQERHLDASIVPTSIATLPQLRMTRCLDGEYALSSDEMHKSFDDSVGLIPDWRKRGPVYEVPCRILYSEKITNLICAGRNVSVTDGMWDIIRVIPCCAVTGEAAGIAASLGQEFNNIDVSEIQRILRSRGVLIHNSELNLSLPL